MYTVSLARYPWLILRPAHNNNLDPTAPGGVAYDREPKFSREVRLPPSQRIILTDTKSPVAKPWVCQCSMLSGDSTKIWKATSEWPNDAPWTGRYIHSRAFCIRAINDSYKVVWLCCRCRAVLCTG